jgi:exonuclease-1
MMAQRKYAEAVDITPEMAFEFITLLKQQNVEYYVAPYEADAQLAYMFKTGRAQVVITEDSDLLIFGVKRVMFKMDKQGNGTEVDLSRLSEVEELNFSTFTEDMLLTCCIVSGCDYIDSIKGIGFKKAHKLVMEHGNDI